MRTPVYRILTPVFCCFLFLSGFSQTEIISRDSLTPAFHAGRRQALRDLMPPNSVMAVFSYPPANFSKDVDYYYHPNPDLYYFSGYKEPNALLLIFKDMQTDANGSYNELFFVQHRDPLRESWTGKRLGVEGVQTKLGFARVYNGDAFGDFSIDLKKFNLIYDNLPDSNGELTPGELSLLVRQFVAKSGIQPQNKLLEKEWAVIYHFVRPNNVSDFLDRRKARYISSPYKEDPMIQALLSKPDSVSLMAFRKEYQLKSDSGPTGFDRYTNILRNVKTPEELKLIRDAVAISCEAHKESMRAATPQMSERELEGISLYVHKKYGSEEEAYPPIVGAGADGCILHYEENVAPHLDNQLVLMDVGAMYHQYSSDVTRTFPANGKFTEEQKEIYQLVYDAQEEVFKHCKAGLRYDSLEAVTVRFLGNGLMKLGLITDLKQVRKYYPHGVSHPLGLDVHDKGVSGMLLAGMVITVEPGIYIPAGSAVEKKWWNIGVRIEDDVQINADGYSNLSEAAPRSWQDVEKMCAQKSLFNDAKFPVIQ